MRFQSRRPLIVAVMFGALIGVGRPSAFVPVPPQNELWMAPGKDLIASRARLARAVADYSTGRAADALPVFLAATDDATLGPHARLFAARAYVALGKTNDVARMVESILSRPHSDALAESALNVSVEAALLASDERARFQALQQMTGRPASSPAATLFRLLQTAIQIGDRPAATTAFHKMYFDYPAAPETADAIEEMERIKVLPPPPSRTDLDRHMARAQALYAAAKYLDARGLFGAIQPLAAGEQRELAQLRVAQSDFFLKKHAVAAPALRAFADKAGARASEAEYYYLAALKALGRTPEYESQSRQFAGRADAQWAERALNDLGTHFILIDEDQKAADVFAEQYRRFPQGAFADRAAWRAGWWAYKQKQFADTIRMFEAAAVSMRRADYRPGWLYWAARAHLESGNKDAAVAGFRRVIADYRNSYYGRAAIQEIERAQPVVRAGSGNAISPSRSTWPVSLTPAARPANSGLIEHLLAAEMFDDAIAELRRLQATGQGSPLVDATIAYAFNKQGKLRFAITAMRRAYPQFMAEGGEALPQEILAVIFPIDHWPLLRQYAAAKNLDPYLVAALVAQESTFQADVRSSANAWGLMQIIPATGRRYAATLGIKPFSTFRLTEPDINVRIGTQYFSDLLKRFGDVAPALAAYNAGPERVVRWLAERPGFDRDEFIDDIPFPETQNYVKRIIGTTEDYRILYGTQR